jgi:hypothetical protein
MIIDEKKKLEETTFQEKLPVQPKTKKSVMISLENSPKLGHIDHPHRRPSRINYLESNFDSIYRSSREPYGGSSIGKVLQGENLKQVKSILTEKKRKKAVVSPKKIGTKKSNLKKPGLVDDAGNSVGGRRASNISKLSSVNVCLDEGKYGKMSSQVNCVEDQSEFTRTSKNTGRKSDMLLRKVSRLTDDAKSPYAYG